MKVLLLICIVQLLCVISVFSQPPPPPPPPPPLIYMAPEAADLTVFSDSENMFKVSFPGIPKKDVWVGENVKRTTYKVYRRGSNSSISIILFPSNMDLRSKELYESYKEKLNELTNHAPSSIPSKVSIITYDREIEIGGIKGREFGYESDFHFTQVAVFVLGERFFEIKTDVTNWHILKKHKPETVKAFQTEANRFRDSFSLLKLLN